MNMKLAFQLTLKHILRILKTQGISKPHNTYTPTPSSIWFRSINRPMKKITCTITTLIIIFGIATQAQNPGDLDLNLNGSGKLFLDVNGGDELATEVLFQPDGKIIMTGTSTTPTSYDFVVARLNPDGSPDPTFSYDGIATTLINTGGVVCYGSVLQDDGKIILAGFGSFITGTNGIVVRYTEDGALDNSFGTGGKVQLALGPNGLAITNVALQPDGKIVCSGMYHNGTDGDMMVLRLNSDGSYDTDFSTDGVAYYDLNNSNDVFWDLAVQDDGKIVAVGTTENLASEKEFVVARFNSDGSLDNSFSSGGYTEIDFANLDNDATSIKIHDNQIFVAGKCNNGSLIVMTCAKLNSDGTMDQSFGSSGKMLIPFYSGSVAGANGICIQPDGKVLLAGYADAGIFKEFAVARLNTDGSLDISFGTGGKIQTDLSDHDVAYSVTMQDDGKFLVAGRSTTTSLDMSLVRYLSGINIGIGNVEANVGHTLIYPNPVVDNKVVIEYELKVNQRIAIELLDLSGKQISVIQPEKNENAGAYKKTLTLPDLAAGNYILNLITENGSVGIRLAVN